MHKTLNIIIYMEYGIFQVSHCIFIRLKKIIQNVILSFFLSNVEQINKKESYIAFYLIHFKTTKTIKNFIIKNKNKNNCNNINYSKK